MIGVIDYGAGNLHSVLKAFRHIGSPACVVDRPDVIRGIDRLVLPGVGQFQSALESMAGAGLSQEVSGWLAANRPFMGICLGMQLLFEESEESAVPLRGFAGFAGQVRRFRGKKSLHMGWNFLTRRESSPLFQGLDEDSRFYFVHRFYAVPADAGAQIAGCDFQGEFAAVVQLGNIYGVQFHPEKSGEVGLQLLRNWVCSC